MKIHMVDTCLQGCGEWAGGVKARVFDMLTEDLLWIFDLLDIYMINT